MAEPRRVQLNSLPVVALTPLDLKKPPSSDAKDEAVEAEPAAAVRITLTLFEPDHKRCPEFFYPELVRNPRGKGKALLTGEKKKEPLSLFNDEEIEKRDVESLAKKFEEKYGSKKRRRDRVQDLIDMGYGYDDTDSFIDNSEAYDELVPASLSTKYGGFYINSGTLQFRQASESEDDFTKEKKKKSPKKQKMKDGDENPKKKRKEDLTEKEKKSKKAKYPKAEFTALNGIKEKKKKKCSMSMDDMLRKFQKEKESQKEDEQTVTSSSSPLQVVMPAQREAECMSDPLLSLFGSATASDLLQAASAMETLSDLDLERLLNDSPDSSPFPEVEDGSEPSLGASPEPSVKPPPSIPEGLPEPLEKRITELTQAARAADGDPKHKFFTQEINTILLDIELQSRELNGSQRSSVYSHLALFLPFSKETLLKRARRLHRHEQGGRLKEPLQKLKEAIGRAMPQQVGKYHKECQAHTQAKFAKMLEEEKDKEQRDRVFSDDEEDDDKGGKRVMGPRKKFQWNEEIRELLSHVVKIKVDCFQLGKNKLLGLEDFLKAFLDAEVKPLWPKGWMQARTLFKESRRVSTHPTLMMARRKVMTATKMKDASYKPDKKSLLPRLLSGMAGSVPSEQVGLSYVPGKATRDVISHSTTLPSVSVLPSTPCGKDSTLDGDLILQPPILEGVSAELAILKARAGSISDVPPTTPSKVSPEKVPTAATSEDKRNPPRPSPSPLPAGSLQQSLSFLSEHTMVGGQVSHEKKLERTSYKGLCNPIPASKILPVTHPEKQRHHSVQRSTFPGPQVLTQGSTTVPIKLFHLNSQQQKTFSLPTHMNKPQVPKAPSSLLTLPLRPVFQPPKCLAKPQSFHSMVTSSSSSTGGTQVSSSSYKASNLSCAGKHSVSSSTSGQAFRSTFLPSSISKHVTPTSNSAPGSSAAQSPVSGSSLLVSQSPSPGQASGRPIVSTLVKKSTPSQKLTLVAPPGGSNADAGGGTQGVAKLLTSSVTSAVSSTISSSTPIMSLKGTGGATLLTASSSISVLSPTFKSTKLPGALSTTPLGILSPIHSFPLHVIAFTPETAAKVGVSSKDAIVTGPAPGTFHHGLHNDAQNHGKGPNGQQRKL